MCDVWCVIIERNVVVWSVWSVCKQRKKRVDSCYLIILGICVVLLNILLMCMQGIQLSESIHNDVSEKFYDWHRNGDSEIRAKGSRTTRRDASWWTRRAFSGGVKSVLNSRTFQGTAPLEKLEIWRIGVNVWHRTLPCESCMTICEENEDAILTLWIFAQYLRSCRAYHNEAWSKFSFNISW